MFIATETTRITSPVGAQRLAFRSSGALTIPELVSYRHSAPSGAKQTKDQEPSTEY